MKFSLLLFILFRKLKKASRKKESFIHYIRNKNARILIGTADGKRSRMFVFSNGTVSSPKNEKGGYDVAMLWADADSGFKAMISDNDADTMVAWKAGKLRVEGNANMLMWFTGAVKTMMKK